MDIPELQTEPWQRHHPFVERTLEVRRLADAHWSLLATFSDDERVRAEPFAAIELELGQLWADVEPAPGK
jgi:hypothetical protein